MLLCIGTTSAFAFTNPLKDSYGIWVGGDNEISVSERGLDDIANNNGRCGEDGKGERKFKTQKIDKIKKRTFCTVLILNLIVILATFL